MKIKNLIIKAAIFIFVLGISAFLMYRYGVFENINLKSVQEYINSYGVFAAPAYIVLFAVRTLLVIFPYSIMALLGGSLFGPFYGFIYTMLSVFISASIAFFISRYLGKEYVQKLLKGKAKKLDLKVEEHGFRIIFVMRVSCLFPLDILSYAAGLTKVKYRDFILATVLGIMPETFSITYLGGNLGNPFSHGFMIAVSLVVLTVAVPFLYTRIKDKRNKKNS